MQLKNYICETFWVQCCYKKYRVHGCNCYLLITQHQLFNLTSLISKFSKKMQLKPDYRKKRVKLSAKISAQMQKYDTTLSLHSNYYIAISHLPLKYEPAFDYVLNFENVTINSKSYKQYLDGVQLHFYFYRKAFSGVLLGLWMRHAESTTFISSTLSNPI